MKILLNIYLIGCLLALSCADRVAPGVPPQHYQQVPQHVQMQQGQQYQMNHVPVHQQQQVHHQAVHNVPVQQMPVQHQPIQHQQQVQHQPPAQQVPVQHVHTQNHGHQGQLLNAANIAHEKEHIAEHLEVPMDTSKMTEQELQFHYFKMHDADNNNKLDGCELIKSLIHWHDPQSGVQHQEEVQTDEELSQIVDPLMKVMDINNDGFVDYGEFKSEVKNV